MVQAILMCAGKSTRTYPLTLTKPKPLLKIANKTILEHNLDQLNDLVSEVIIIVGYKKEMIIHKFGNNYKNLKIKYVEQKEQLGTAHAVLQAKNHIKGKFVLLNGDDFFCSDDIKSCLKFENSMLLKEVEDPKKFGVVEVEGNKVKNIVEKPDHPKSNLVNTGMYVLNKSIFNLLETINKSSRGEYELVDAIKIVSNEQNMYYRLVEGYWIPIVYAWDLLFANEFFVSNIGRSIAGIVEPNATIKGNVIVGENTVIKNGAYIEGPAIVGENCTIGPNCYIRSFSSIGDNCKIGNAVEIKNSILMKDVCVGHLSYIGDSIIGESTNIAAGNITANLRHDGKNVITKLNNKRLDTKRRKLGMIIGDHVHTGINNSFYPGRKIWPYLHTCPGDVVKKDIIESKEE